LALVDGGRLVAKALRAQGVQHIFTLSGGHIASIYEGCLHEGVGIVDTRHEQAAAHMAEGWARVTGKPGVAVVTAGPGVTDAITGIANAWDSASPIVVLGGHSPLAHYERGAMQELDQLGMMGTVTKWARACYQTARLPDYVATAFRHAASGRPGPVYLEVPWDVLDGRVDESEVERETGQPSPVGHPAGEPAVVERAVAVLKESKRPVIVAGSGARWSGASEELRALAEAMHLPVVLVSMGRGCMPEDHPLCFGPTRVGLRQADVILVVGTRLNHSLAYGGPSLFNADATIIQLDIEASEIGHNRGAHVGIVGDAASVLGQMATLASGQPVPEERRTWVQSLQDYAEGRRKRQDALAQSSTVPIHPLRLCAEITSVLERDAIVVLDGGEISAWGAGALHSYHPGHWLDNLPGGYLGPGLPFALAAKLACPNKQVLLLIGDGSFGLNAMEFDTAVRFRLPIVAVIGNDGAWGMIKHAQEAIYGPGRTPATELGVTRYERIVTALGGYGEWVERPEDIRPALARAFASGLPACVNVATDPRANPFARASA
jgi:acetolactate synthase-1/2/3 large subunit